MRRLGVLCGRDPGHRRGRDRGPGVGVVAPFTIDGLPLHIVFGNPTMTR